MIHYYKTNFVSIYILSTLAFCFILDMLLLPLFKFSNYNYLHQFFLNFITTIFMPSHFSLKSLTLTKQSSLPLSNRISVFSTKCLATNFPFFLLIPVCLLYSHYVLGLAYHHSQFHSSLNVASYFPGQFPSNISQIFLLFPGVQYSPFWSSSLSHGLVW